MTNNINLNDTISLLSRYINKAREQEVRITDLLRREAEASTKVFSETDIRDLEDIRTRSRGEIQGLNVAIQELIAVRDQN